MTINQLYINPEGDKLTISISVGVQESIENINLYSSFQFGKKELAHNLFEIGEDSPMEYRKEVTAASLGFLLFEDMYVLEITYTDINRKERVMNIVFGNMTKIYYNMTEAVSSLKLDGCGILGTDSCSTTIDIATKNFIDYEAFKLAVQAKDICLAMEIYSIMDFSASRLNCSKFDLIPILGFNFIKEDEV